MVLPQKGKRLPTLLLGVASSVNPAAMQPCILNSFLPPEKPDSHGKVHRAKTQYFKANLAEVNPTA